MENIKVLMGTTKLVVYNVRLIKGEFFVLILFGLKDSSTIYNNKLKNIESDIQIFWSDVLIKIDPKNIKVYLESYSIMLTFKFRDIK